MPRPKRAPVPDPLRPTEAFASTEEAWFWFARCQASRYAGARFDRLGAGVSRPCDPDDIYRVVIGLRRTGRIEARHVAVLVRFGAALRPPDPRIDNERQAARLWDEGLDRLTTVLRAKGIVEDG